jgi:hypothetical protein
VEIMMGPGVIVVLLAYLLPAVLFLVVLYFVVLAAVRTALELETPMMRPAGAGQRSTAASEVSR